MIGKAKRRIRISMMSMTLFWCAIVTLVVWGLLIRCNATDEIMHILLVSLCATGILEIMTLIASLLKCHRFTKHVYAEENANLIDADQFQKIDRHYSLGNTWFTYHKGIDYYVFSKQNNTFRFDHKHIYVIKDGQAFCFKANETEINALKQWVNI